jgi:predicted RNA-binding Zn ribbon-like protein
LRVEILAQQLIDTTLATLLAPVVWSAADLLVDKEARRVRQRLKDHCRWLFVDDSKSGTRRWWSLTSCGNRAKAQRHYVRLKNKSPAGRRRR